MIRVQFYFIFIFLFDPSWSESVRVDPVRLLYLPIHLPIVLLNPLLNAFLAGILCQLFLQHQVKIVIKNSYAAYVQRNLI